MDIPPRSRPRAVGVAGLWGIGMVRWIGTWLAAVVVSVVAIAWIEGISLGGAVLLGLPGGTVLAMISMTGERRRRRAIASGAAIWDALVARRVERGAWRRGRLEPGPNSSLLWRASVGRGMEQWSTESHSMVSTHRASMAQRVRFVASIDTLVRLRARSGESVELLVPSHVADALVERLQNPQGRGS